MRAHVAQQIIFAHLGGLESAQLAPGRVRVQKLLADSRQVRGVRDQRPPVGLGRLIFLFPEIGTGFLIPCLHGPLLGELLFLSERLITLARDRERLRLSAVDIVPPLLHIHLVEDGADDHGDEPKCHPEQGDVARVARQRRKRQHERPRRDDDDGTVRQAGEQQRKRVAHDRDVQAEQETQDVGDERRHDDDHAEEPGDHAQLADEIIDATQRPGEIKRQGVEAQILADEARADQQYHDHREGKLDLQESGGSRASRLRRDSASGSSSMSREKKPARKGRNGAMSADPFSNSPTATARTPARWPAARR